MVQTNQGSGYGYGIIDLDFLPEMAIVCHEFFVNGMFLVYILIRFVFEDKRNGKIIGMVNYRSTGRGWHADELFLNHVNGS